ncbi:MAG: hypothetical protein ACKO69_03590 [Limnohabitans sp.]
MTATEQEKLGSLCIQTRCDHLGPTGCRMGDHKPFGCNLYPLSYNPNNKSFYFDTDCPLMDDYLHGLSDVGSDASIHLQKARQEIVQLEKIDPAFLQLNHQVDVAYFDLKRITAVHFSPKQNKKKSNR